MACSPGRRGFRLDLAFRGAIAGFFFVYASRVWPKCITVSAANCTLTAGLKPPLGIFITRACGSVVLTRG